MINGQNTQTFTKIIFFFILILQLTQQITIETIELPLTAADDGRLTTFIPIGNIEQKMQIDINDFKIKVCCKYEDSIFQKVYYFLFNPFFQVYDYTCKKPDQHGLVTDSAKILNLGLIPISFYQQEFPICNKGVLGLNNQSQFLSLLPKNLKTFTIFRNPSEYKKYTLKFGQDGPAVKQYVYFNTLHSQSWGIESSNIKFNQVQLGNYTISLNSNSNTIKLPKTVYQFTLHELITTYQCRQIGSQIYCPCETGSTSSYPSFFIVLRNGFELQINPDRYMIQDSQICKVQVSESKNNCLEASILFFQDFVFKFDPAMGKIGILKSLNDQGSHQKIKLPLQLILNCLVILLLCIFLALVLIQIIKRVSGLAQVRDEVFRVDIRDKHDFHYASQ